MGVFRKKDALRCISWATEELRIQTRWKQHEADETFHDVDRLQETDLFGADPTSREGLLLGKTYQHLKVASDATLLKMQADAAQQMAPLLDKLPTSLQKLVAVDQAKKRSRCKRVVFPSGMISVLRRRWVGWKILEC